MLRLARVLAAAGVCAAGQVATAAPCPPTTVDQLVSWRRADVVTGRLVNGVVVHHRRMPDAGFTVVAATVTPGFDDEATGAAAAQAAEEALAGDARAAGLRLDVMAVEQGLMAIVRGPDERIGDMCALVARLASVPVQFHVVDAGPRGTSARAVMRRAMDAVFDQRPLVIRPQLDAAAAVAGARWPVEDAPGSMEVAVVGSVGFAEAIAAADTALGTLPARQAPALCAAAPALGKVASHVVTVRSDDTNLAEGREAVAVGVLVRNGETLAGQRAIALAWTLLRLRIGDAADQDDQAEIKPGVQFILRGLRPGTAVITITATCPEGEGARLASRFDESIRRLATDPVGSDEFERARSAYLDTTRQLLEDATYWAKVLASSSTRGYTPDELANVEADIKAVTPTQVTSLLTRALAEHPPVTIHVRASDKIGPAEKVGQP